MKKTLSLYILIVLVLSSFVYSQAFNYDTMTDECESAGGEIVDMNPSGQYTTGDATCVSPDPPLCIDAFSGTYYRAQCSQQTNGYACCCDPTVWYPDPSEYCVGESFTQTNCAGDTITSTGTAPITSWTPDESEVCAGVPFTKTSNCIGPQQEVVGTKSDSTWTPDENDICDTETGFTQTGDCGGTRTGSGAKDCGGISCSVTNGPCIGVAPFSIYNTSLPGGSHVAVGEGYDYKVCCAGIAGLGTSCSGNSEIILKLYYDTNSHAAREEATEAELTEDICLSSPGAQLECDYIAGGQTCANAGYQTCLATMDTLINTHMTDCDTDIYPIRLCCRDASCEPTLRECPDTGSCACIGGQYMCENNVNQTCDNTYTGTECTTCTPDVCDMVDSGADTDGDGLDNQCEAEGVADVGDGQTAAEECTDGINNDNDPDIDYEDQGCVNFCPDCRGCGTGWFNICEESECTNCGTCHYYAINNCCPDSDNDGACDDDGSDVCIGYDDNIHSDNDGVPDGCDPLPYDSDDDGDDDDVDCWDDDGSLGVGDPNPDGDMFDCENPSQTWPGDGCQSDGGVYADFTNCALVCEDGIEKCNCGANADYITTDNDGDGITNLCEADPQFIDDPCSTAAAGDNCAAAECMADVSDFCTHCNSVTYDTDTDGDGVVDTCEAAPEFVNDPCSAYVAEDNCGVDLICPVGGIAYCDNCPGSGDNDGDFTINECDTETGADDCNDGLDNDGDGLCDDRGCVCNSGNNYCGTGDSLIVSMEGDDECFDVCDGCDYCGAGFFDFCDEFECENICGACNYLPGFLGIGNGCCPDDDQDGVCNDEDKCPGFDDNLNADGDEMPDDCDTCPTEPAITIEELTDSEEDCGDNIDNDCDLETDAADPECKCWIGTARCSNGECSGSCGYYPPCNSDGVCDVSESCDCSDCGVKQASCAAGFVCDPFTKLCSDEADLTPQLCNPTLKMCENDGDERCWAADISELNVEGKVRCCGDDTEETWSYKSDLFVDDIHVKYSCYKGKWRNLRNIGVTYYKIGLNEN